MNNKDNYESVNLIINKLNNLYQVTASNNEEEDEDETWIEDNMNKVSNYVEVRNIYIPNLKQELGVEYNSVDFDYYEAALDLNYIEPKKDFINLLGYFNNLIDLKLKEGIKWSNNFNNLEEVLDYQKISVLNEIKSRLKKKNFNINKEN